MKSNFSITNLNACKNSNWLDRFGTFFVNNAFEDRIIIERMLDKYKFINILKVKLSQ